MSLLTLMLLAAVSTTDGDADLIDEMLRLPPLQAENVEREEQAAEASLSAMGFRVMTGGRLTPEESRLVLNATSDRFERIDDFVTGLSRDQEIVDEVAAQYTAHLENGGEAIEKVDRWLVRNDPDRVDELEAAARTLADEEYWTDREEDLIALADRHYERAAPLLQALLEDEDPGLVAFALSLLHEHGGSGSEPSYRKRLMAIADDESAPAQARDIAIETLGEHSWPGRQEWVRAAFSRYGELRSENMVYSPLSSIVADDPDQWIPVMIELLDDPESRANAADALGQFHLKDARRDALEPLIPWLSDPGWAEDLSMTRLRLVQTVADLEMTEAVPGLEWIIRNDDDDSLIAYAAIALVELGQPGAVAFAREAMKKSSSMYCAQIASAIASEDLETSDEIADRILEFLEAVATEEGAKKFYDALYSFDAEADCSPILGSRYANEIPPRPDLLEKLIEIADGGGAPSSLASSLAPVDSGIIDRWLIQRLAEGRTGSEWELYFMLDRRESVVATSRGTLREMVGSGGFGAGFAAALLSDEEAILRTKQADSEAIRSFLAAARILREPVDVPAVVRLTKDDPLLLPASSAYLEILNTREARNAIAALYPGELRVVGERPLHDAGHSTFEFFDAWEEGVVGLMKREGYDRIDAFAAASYFRGGMPLLVIGRGPNGVDVWYLDGEEVAVVEGGANLLATLDQIIHEIRPDDLPPLVNERVEDGVQYEYLSMTKDLGHRLFISNPHVGYQVEAYVKLVDGMLEIYDSFVATAGEDGSGDSD